MPEARDQEQDHLARYLNDHWAGAGAGSGLAQTFAEHNDDTAWHGELQRIADDIESDESDLERLRDRADVGGGTLKRVIAEVGAQVRRLSQLNLGGYSDLSRLLETEALIVGVKGKQRLWDVLGANVDADPRLKEVDLARLERRASEQIATLEEFHRQAGVVAFDPGCDRDEVLRPPTATKALPDEVTSNLSA